ncbi:MAG: single-stranded DNA-binding protein [Planctomycetota bacterium]
MSNYNKVLLIGRLTRDPELRYTPQGTPVSEIGLAVNREYAVGNERRKETTFVDVTLWRRQAEVACQYLKKGQPIFIEGRLVLDSWETPDGQRRSRLRVVADNFQFLGGRPGEDAYAGGPEEAGDAGPEPFPSPGAGRGDWSGGARRTAPKGPQESLPRAPRPAAPPPAQPSEEEGPLGLDEDEPPF